MPLLRNRSFNLLADAVVVGGSTYVLLDTARESKRRRYSKTPDRSRSVLVNRTSLLMLPDETLLTIMQYLGPKCLFALLISCLRLHYIAFPVYLARLGLVTRSRYITRRSPGEKLEFAFEDRKDYEALKALCVTPMITELDTLSCVFTGTSLKWLRLMTRFVSRLSRIDSIYADFAFEDIPLTEEFTTAYIRGLEEFFRSLSGASCARVALVGHLFFPLSIPRLLSGIRPLTNLTMLRIAFPVLFRTSFRTWIIHSINASPITRLTLHCVGLPKRTWTETLPLLTLPALSTLDIRLDSLRFDDLSAFLFRHSSIISLKIHNMPVHARCLPVDALPLLRDLTGPVKFVSRLLAQPGGLQALEEICIVSCDQRDVSFFSHLTYCLKCLGARPNTARMRLALTIGEGAYIPTHCCLTTTAWLSEFRAKMNPAGRSVPQVERLEIHLHAGLRFSTVLHVDLPSWLVWFSSVRHVVLICRSCSQRDKLAMLPAIWAACPSLQTLEFAPHVWSPSCQRDVVRRP